MLLIRPAAIVIEGQGHAPQAACSASMLATEPEQYLAIDRLYRRQPATAMVFILQPELAAFKFQQPAVAIGAPLPVEQPELPLLQQGLGQRKVIGEGDLEVKAAARHQPGLQAQRLDGTLNLAYVVISGC